MSGTKAWAVVGPDGKIRVQTVRRTQTAAWDAIWGESELQLPVPFAEWFKDFIKRAKSGGYRAVRVRIEVAPPAASEQEGRDGE